MHIDDEITARIAKASVAFDRQHGNVLSLNRDTLITFLSFIVIVACLYLSCMSSVMILC